MPKFSQTTRQRTFTDVIQGVVKRPAKVSLNWKPSKKSGSKKVKSKKKGVK